MHETPLRIDVLHDGSVARVSITGEVDDTNVDAVSRAVLELPTPPIETVELDLAGVAYLGSAGVRALVEAEELATAASVTIVAASPIARRVLDLTGMARMLARPASDLPAELPADAPR